MSELAVIEQRKKQGWAAPGGFHDKLMTALKLGLPALIGLLLAYLAVAPLTRSREISFVLDKNKVETAKERMRMQTAQYRGQDDKGRPFTIDAQSAVQTSSRDPNVHINGVKANIQLEDGPAAFTANKGRYNLENEQVAVEGPVVVTGPNNYRLHTNDVTVDLNSKKLQSQKNVQGTMSLGTYSADGMQADLEARTVTLDGRARLQISQGALKRKQ
jgi:lipopolysaccharide export system protein LptC